MKINKIKLSEFLKINSVYTVAETQVLQKLLEIEENGVATIKTKELQKQLNISNTAIYSSLKNLQFKDVIIKLRDQRNSYKLNENTLESILKE